MLCDTILRHFSGDMSACRRSRQDGRVSRFTIGFISSIFDRRAD